MRKESAKETNFFEKFEIFEFPPGLEGSTTSGGPRRISLSHSVSDSQSVAHRLRLTAAQDPGNRASIGLTL